MIEGKIKVKFQGDNCLHCPVCIYESTWHEYKCMAVRENGSPKRIAKYVEYPVELGPRPDWCPIDVKEDK